MKAAVWKGIEQLDVEELPIPTPAGPFDVQVKVAACGVCGTDVHILEGKFPLFTPPRVIGHEYVGIVSAVGKEVTKFKPGDRVAVEQGLPCDRCYYCRDGREHQCLNRFAHPGGFAEYT
ncbi:MAG TPA: alcohol dehydrogenase catalytic domain-containing protein, partial [Candidatus Acidoferrum sp.]|nr:alcohol dehydrogenase catalytic domain-containing protein [Candidatus Acidoferrum sp.]